MEGFTARIGPIIERTKRIVEPYVPERVIWFYRTVRKWYRDAKTMRKVRRAQAMIVPEASEYYRKRYRKREVFTWGHIPAWLLKLAPSTQTRILDVGCGYGTLATFTKLNFGCEVCCIDNFVGNAPRDLFRSMNIYLAQANVELEPIPFDGQFDIIIFTEVLEHLNFNPTCTLQKLVTALEPGGKILLTTPDCKGWGKVYDYYRHISEAPAPDPSLEFIDAHVWQYSIDELLSVLDAVGLIPVEFEYSSPPSGWRHFNTMLVRKSELKRISRPFDNENRFG